MIPPASRLLLFGALALGCRACDSQDRGATAALDGGARNARVDRVDGGACARRPVEIEGPYRDLCLGRDEVERFAASLQEGLTREDRARVASLVRYPFRVHTARCIKHLGSPPELLAHYDEVFTPSLKSDILSARPPFFVRDRALMLASAGRLWAWVGDEERLLLGGVFLGAGDIAGVPCADRAPEAIPESVWGTWAVSSVRAGPLEQLVSFPWEKWKGLTLSLEASQRTLMIRMGAGEKVCHDLWFARDTSVAPDDSSLRPCSAFESFWPRRARERSRILAATCPGGDVSMSPTLGTAVPPELLVVDADTMALRLGCEGITILKKRPLNAAEPPRRLAALGAPCGAPGVDCAPGARCVAVSAEPLVEVCRALDQPAQ